MVVVKQINLEVAYVAASGQQALLTLQVPANWTVAQVLRHSQITEQFPELQGQALKIGVFGRHGTEDDLLEEGDRIELYRPLKQDPKIARSSRVKQGMRDAQRLAALV